MIVLTTARQTLRMLTPDDAASMFALNTDADVIRFTPDRPAESVEAERASLERYQDVYRADGFARWAAIETATGAWLGWCGLRKQADGEVDVGYRYAKSAWGRGFATEAARASVAWGFEALSLARIVARVEPANVASVRVLEKCGLRLERRELEHAKPVDLWSVSRADWTPPPRVV